MKKHARIYLKAFGHDLGIPFDEQYIKSELSNTKAVDIHHIIGRGKCGEDRIENLMALTRKQHDDFGDKKRYVWTLLSVHRQELKMNNIPFDNEWFENNMKRYAYQTTD